MHKVKVLKKSTKPVYCLTTGSTSCLVLKPRWFYTNYRGVTEDSVFVPESIWFGKTEFHPEHQWLLKATVLDRGEPVQRDFAVAVTKQTNGGQ